MKWCMFTGDGSTAATPAAVSAAEPLVRRPGRRRSALSTADNDSSCRARCVDGGEARVGEQVDARPRFRSRRRRGRRTVRRPGSSRRSSGRDVRADRCRTAVGRFSRRRSARRRRPSDHVRHHAHRRVELRVLARRRRAGRAPMDQRDEHGDRAEEAVARILVAHRRHRLVELARHLVRRADVARHHRREALTQHVRAARSPTRRVEVDRVGIARPRPVLGPSPSRSAAPGRMLWCTTSAQSSRLAIAGCEPRVLEVRRRGNVCPPARRRRVARSRGAGRRGSAPA